MYVNLGKKTDSAQDQVIDIVLKDYEKNILKIVYDLKGELTSSREVWELCNDQGFKISRASAINFLNYLSDKELIKYSEKSGKGGMAGRYRAPIGTTLKNAYNMIAFDIMVQLYNELEQPNLIWAAMNIQGRADLLTGPEIETITDSLRNTLTDSDQIAALAVKLEKIKMLE